MNSLNLSPVRLLLLIAAAIGLATSLHGQLVVTYAELPDEVNSRLDNTSVFTFNDLNANRTYTGKVWQGVGVFDRLRISSPDNYGGAADASHPNGSNYALQDSSHVSETNLVLYTSHAYFGLWWSAGDTQNILRFYDGETLVGEFTTATLLDRLASDPGYKGNPRNRSLNSGEAYAFINFFGMDGTTWDRVQLTNGAGTGFESDNYTDREAAWNEASDGPMPGKMLAVLNGGSITAVPETGSLSMAGLALSAFLVRRRVSMR